MLFHIPETFVLLFYLQVVDHWSTGKGTVLGVSYVIKEKLDLHNEDLHKTHYCVIWGD